MVDSAGAGVRGDETIGQLGDGQLHKSEYSADAHETQAARDLRFTIYDLRAARHAQPLVNRISYIVNTRAATRTPQTEPLPPLAPRRFRSYSENRSDTRAENTARTARWISASD